MNDARAPTRETSSVGSLSSHHDSVSGVGRRGLLQAIAAGVPLVATLSPRSALGAQASAIARLTQKDAIQNPGSYDRTGTCVSPGSGQWLTVRAQEVKIYLNNPGGCKNGTQDPFYWGIQVVFDNQTKIWRTQTISDPPSNTAAFPTAPVYTGPITLSTLDGEPCSIEETTGSRYLIALFSISGTDIVPDGYYPLHAWTGWSGGSGRFAMHASTWSSLVPNQTWQDAGYFGC